MRFRDGARFTYRALFNEAGNGCSEEGGVYGAELPVLSVVLTWPLPLTSVTLYNCSVGREDCSLCKNAEPQYLCVWCARKRSCIYSELCQGNERQDCPNPKITEVRVCVCVCMCVCVCVCECECVCVCVCVCECVCVCVCV